ncbi:hypothetical protein KI387_014541 [Taxus chinensis]|uniref:Uncharacterized protein n=1 Tax=Taxus chinensis TaxID=29808 RepID=A0AA38CUM5_TAXCH|nr:hypothetical protein KI387_014541 [Taxus chinensis]
MHIMRLVKAQMEEDNYSARVLSDISNLNMVEDIFDVSQELGFGEGEDWMPNTDVPLKKVCGAELSETKLGNCKESARSIHARADFLSNKSTVKDDIEANEAMEMPSPDTQDLCQKQPFLSRFIQKKVNDINSETVNVERKSLTSTHMKVKQLKSLAKENVSEGINENGNVEHLVSKVENAVKFEIMVDELQLKMKANRDNLKKALFGNEYKTEKIKSQLETVGVYWKKVQEPRHDTKVGHAEKENAKQVVFETRNGTVNYALKQSSEQEKPPLEVSSNRETIVEIVSGDEGAFPNSQNMEHQLIRHKVLELWKAEVSEHKDTCDRLKYLENFMIHLHREAVKLNSVLQAGSIKNTMFTLINFFKSLAHIQVQGPQNSCGYHKHARQPFKVEYLERLKEEMQELEAKNNRLESELNAAIKKGRDLEERNEVLWMEKERHFTSEIVSLQEKACCLNEHIERVDSNHIQERHHWKEELEMCRNECTNKLEVLQYMLKEREEKLMNESVMWSRLLEAKDEELHSLESVIRKAVHTLTTTKRQLYDLKRHLISQRTGFTKDQGLGQEDEGSHTFSTGSASEFQYGIDISDVEECGLKMPILLEKLATHTETDICRLGVEIREDYDRMEKEKIEARLLTMQVKQEKTKNEEQLAERLFLMERFKGEMESKEAHLDWERKQLEMSLKLKSEEVEKLRGELYTKQQQTQIIRHKFQDEKTMIMRELDKERSERQQDRDQYHSSCQKMVKEILEKEQAWKKQMKGLAEDFLKLKAHNINNDNEIEMLREKIHDILTRDAQGLQ